MKQQSLAAQGGFEKYGRKSRRELFLDEMEQVVPWSALESLVRCATLTISLVQKIGQSNCR
jgi:IS5 family transposase